MVKALLIGDMFFPPSTSLKQRYKVSPQLTPPLHQTVVCASDLKALNVQMMFPRKKRWSIVKTLGKMTVKAKTSNYIFRSRAKTCPSVNNAGAK